MSNLILLGMRFLSDALPTDTRRHLKGMTDAPSPQSCVSRLLIADDRSRTRRALRAVFSTQPEIELIGEAADGEEAIAAVERLRKKGASDAAIRAFEEKAARVSTPKQIAELEREAMR